VLQSHCGSDGGQLLADMGDVFAAHPDYQLDAMQVYRCRFGISVPVCSHRAPLLRQLAGPLDQHGKPCCAPSLDDLALLLANTAALVQAAMGDKSKHRDAKNLLAQLAPLIPPCHQHPLVAMNSSVLEGYLRGRFPADFWGRVQERPALPLVTTDHRKDLRRECRVCASLQRASRSFTP
jgi:hypothetical protein